MENIKLKSTHLGQVTNGIIIGKETINEKTYANVKTTLGKVIIEEDELHDFDVRDKVGLLLGAEIELIVEEYDDELEAYVGSRKRACEIKSKQLEKKIGQEINAKIIILAKNNLIANINGIDARIKSKELGMGWIEDLREKFKIGDDLKVKVTGVEPFEFSIVNKENNFDENMYKVGNEYVGKIVGTPSFGIIVELDNNRQVLCYKVDWNDEPSIDDVVVVQISDVKVNEQKTYGYLKRRIRR